MKIGFYPRLAADGIRKNKRMFLPFILTCTGMVMMFYIIMYLAAGSFLDSVFGEETLRQFFALGSWVIAVFAAIFLFYTNSFLIRRRKKEFGLYNILGMGKRNIARVLFWETLIVAGISVTGGLILGVSFSKFAELGMLNLLHQKVSYDLSVSGVAVLRSLEVFGVIFLLLLLNSIRQVRFSTAVSLLRSENTGEKPPKGNWLFGLLGVALLAAAYYLAATIEDPVSALVVFFGAVIMVICGTYLVMISGSVLFCRLLQKKKSYYYKPNHFVSVSSMVYRMKRNGAGLASICILATMVLVMMASTTCLYVGEEDVIHYRYPREINLSFQLRELSDFSDEHTEELRGAVAKELDARSVSPKNASFYRYASLYGVVVGEVVEINSAMISDVDSIQNSYLISFVPLADYNAMMGTNETLNDGEALLYSYRTDFYQERLTFRDGESFKIKKKIDGFVENGDIAMDVLSSLLLVVPDLETSLKQVESVADYNGNRMLRMKWNYNFDTGLSPADQISLYHELRETLRTPESSEQIGYASVSVSSQEFEKSDFYSLFGSLFYLGIILSLVFLLAAVLIIYYKQISEGYEDQARFAIMQKVGMTKREIRKSINSQLLTVFFFPLALAALHMCFAFLIIRRLLLVFNLNNVLLFAGTTAASLLVFALFYALVYRLTSGAYYKIVSDAREEK